MEKHHFYSSVQESLWTPLLLFVIALALLLYAQADMTRRKSGGWGSDSAYSRLFDPAAPVSFSGEIVALRPVIPLKGMLQGLMLTVRTEEGMTVPVHLGPVWFLREQQMQLRPKDRVTVQGAKAVSSIMATEIVLPRTGTLRLRDRKGLPVWKAMVPSEPTG